MSESIGHVHISLQLPDLSRDLHLLFSDFTSFQELHDKTLQHFSDLPLRSRKLTFRTRGMQVVNESNYNRFEHVYLYAFDQSNVTEIFHPTTFSTLVEFNPHYTVLTEHGEYPTVDDKKSACAYATAELIDNSIDAMRTNAKKHVKLHRFGTKHSCKFLCVEDNGTGMDRTDLRNFARMSLAPKHRKKGQLERILPTNDPETKFMHMDSIISEYGVGAKQAGFFLGTEVVVICSKGDGSVMELHLSEQEMSSLEKNNENAFQGRIISRQPRDYVNSQLSHLHGYADELRRFVEKEPTKSFTRVFLVIRADQAKRLDFSSKSVYLQEIGKIYYFFMSKKDGLTITAHSYGEGRETIDVSGLRNELQQFMADAADTFYDFVAEPEGSEPVNGRLIYLPVRDGVETNPFLRETQSRFEQLFDHRTRLSKKQRERLRAEYAETRKGYEMFLCFWKGRLLPLGTVRSLKWCKPILGKQDSEQERFYRVKGFLFFGDGVTKPSKNKLSLQHTYLEDTLSKTSRRNERKRFLGWVDKCNEDHDQDIGILGLCDEEFNLYSELQLFRHGKVHKLKTGHLLKIQLSKERSHWGMFKFYDASNELVYYRRYPVEVYTDEVLQANAPDPGQDEEMKVFYEKYPCLHSAKAKHVVLSSVVAREEDSKEYQEYKAAAFTSVPYEMKVELWKNRKTGAQVGGDEENEQVVSASPDTVITKSIGYTFPAVSISVLGHPYQGSQKPVSPYHLICLLRYKKPKAERKKKSRGKARDAEEWVSRELFASVVRGTASTKQLRIGTKGLGIGQYQLVFQVQQHEKVQRVYSFNITAGEVHIIEIANKHKSFVYRLGQTQLDKVACIGMQLLDKQKHPVTQKHNLTLTCDDPRVTVASVQFKRHEAKPHLLILRQLKIEPAQPNSLQFTSSEDTIPVQATCRVVGKESVAVSFPVEVMAGVPTQLALVDTKAHIICENHSVLPRLRVAVKDRWNNICATDETVQKVCISSHHTRYSAPSFLQLRKNQRPDAVFDRDSQASLDQLAVEDSKMQSGGNAHKVFLIAMDKANKIVQKLRPIEMRITVTPSKSLAKVFVHLANTTDEDVRANVISVRVSSTVSLKVSLFTETDEAISLKDFLSSLKRRNHRAFLTTEVFDDRHDEELSDSSDLMVTQQSPPSSGSSRGNVAIRVTDAQCTELYRKSRSFTVQCVPGKAVAWKLRIEASLRKGHVVGKTLKHMLQVYAADAYGNATASKYKPSLSTTNNSNLVHSADPVPVKTAFGNYWVFPEATFSGLAGVCDLQISDSNLYLQSTSCRVSLSPGVACRLRCLVNNIPCLPDETLEIDDVCSLELQLELRDESDNIVRNLATAVVQLSIGQQKHKVQLRNGEAKLHGTMAVRFHLPPGDTELLLKSITPHGISLRVPVRVVKRADTVNKLLVTAISDQSLPLIEPFSIRLQTDYPPDPAKSDWFKKSLSARLVLSTGDVQFIERGLTYSRDPDDTASPPTTLRIHVPRDDARHIAGPASFSIVYSEARPSHTHFKLPDVSAEPVELHFRHGEAAHLAAVKKEGEREIISNESLESRLLYRQLELAVVDKHENALPLNTTPELRDALSKLSIVARRDEEQWSIEIADRQLTNNSLLLTDVAFSSTAKFQKGLYKLECTLPGFDFDPWAHQFHFTDIVEERKVQERQKEVLSRISELSTQQNRLQQHLVRIKADKLQAARDHQLSSSKAGASAQELEADVEEKRLAIQNNSHPAVIPEHIRRCMKSRSNEYRGLIVAMVALPTARLAALFSTNLSSYLRAHCVRDGKCTTAQQLRQKSQKMCYVSSLRKFVDRPLPHERSSGPGETFPGKPTWLMSLIRPAANFSADQEFKNIFGNICGNIVVLEDINAATHYKQRLTQLKVHPQPTLWTMKEGITISSNAFEHADVRPTPFDKLSIRCAVIPIKYQKHLEGLNKLLSLQKKADEVLQEMQSVKTQLTPLAAEAHVFRDRVPVAVQHQPDPRLRKRPHDSSNGHASKKSRLPELESVPHRQASKRSRSSKDARIPKKGQKANTSPDRRRKQPRQK